MRLLGSLAFALIVSTAPALAASHTVSIQNYKFAPASVSVAAGDTVVFVNYDSVPHTATAGKGAFDTGQIAPGGKASVKISKAGTFAYSCQIHPMMKGTVKAK
jgi:plastocyanin